MKFYCCGVLYSTDDPETYWCIDKYHLSKPTLNIIGGKKIEKEVVYTLFCKKNACEKLEIHRYYKSNGKLKILETRILKGQSARKYMENTQNMRIRQPQCCPIKPIKSSTQIPWVYGKAINDTTQTARYIDETDNRKVFKNKEWKTEIFKSPLKILDLTL